MLLQLVTQKVSVHSVIFMVTMFQFQVFFFFFITFTTSSNSTDARKFEAHERDCSFLANNDYFGMYDQNTTGI